MFVRDRHDQVLLRGFYGLCLPWIIVSTAGEFQGPVAVCGEQVQVAGALTETSSASFDCFVPVLSGCLTW